jgi:DNA-binding NarL/FixJ family response regulator
VSLTCGSTTQPGPGVRPGRCFPRSAAAAAFDESRGAPCSFGAGADGFLLKDTDPREIIRAVHVVADGQGMLHPAAARRVIDRFHRAARPAALEARSRVGGLAPRETDVLARLARGDSNAEIAAVLGMRESTVKAHVSWILAALGAGNRVQAALLARDAGLGDHG